MNYVLEDSSLLWYFLVFVFTEINSFFCLFVWCSCESLTNQLDIRLEKLLSNSNNRKTHNSRWASCTKSTNL